MLFEDEGRIDLMLWSQRQHPIPGQIPGLRVGERVPDEQLRDFVTGAEICFETAADDRAVRVRISEQPTGPRLQNKRVRDLRVEEHLIDRVCKFLTYRVSVVDIERSPSAPLGFKGVADREHIPEKAVLPNLR